MIRRRFTKAQRLLKRGEFDRLQKGSGTRKAGVANFLVLVVASDLGRPRLGMIASRRVGSAVSRNRAKRLIRHFFRNRAEGLGSFDVVVVVKTGADTLTQTQADGQLATAFTRLGVLKMIKTEGR